MVDFYNESKFHMWRACIGAIWIDGDLDPAEEEWIIERINQLKFTDEQRRILQEDLHSNIDFPNILLKITDKKDRAFLAYQIRVIGSLDNDFSEHEKELYKNWNELVLSQIDLAYWESKIAALEEDSYHVDEVFKVVNKHSVFEKTHRMFQKMTNFGKYKFPDKE